MGNTMLRFAGFALMLAASLCNPLRAQDKAEEAPLRIDAAAERSLQRFGGRDCRIRRTDHFVIAYDTADEALRALVWRLEVTYDSVLRFCKINELPARVPDTRLGVVFFERYEDYAAYAAMAGFSHHGSAGFFNQQNNVAAFVNVAHLPELAPLDQNIADSRDRLQQLRDRQAKGRELLEERRNLTRLTGLRDRLIERTNQMVVQHEVAHHVFFNIGVHVFGGQNPGWLVEGLACLFETPPSVSGGGAGTTNQFRLRDFRAVLGNGQPAGRITADALPHTYDTGRFVHLSELIGDEGLFTRRNDPSLPFYYSQAWSLVYYLQQRHREEFAQYLRLLAGRSFGVKLSSQRELADFTSAFGPLNERFENLWVTYVLSLPYKPSETE